MKPLNGKAYGSIAHLPISKMGKGDKRVHEGQAIICLEKARDKHDEIIVQEKVDGTCVAVARIGGQLTPLMRSGYAPASSPFRQHHIFDTWVRDNFARFEFLEEGERIVGEWLAQAHGIRYTLRHEPFVAFDLINPDGRIPYDKFKERASGFVTAALLHRGAPFPLHRLFYLLGASRHGGECMEGAVYRVERQGRVDFLAKFVRPDHEAGCLLPEFNGSGIEVWNEEASA